MGEREVDWSALPMELLPLIGKTVQARIDVVRFRSVCASWRSFIPPLREISPLPLPFPYPINPTGVEAFNNQGFAMILSNLREMFVYLEHVV